MEGFSVIRVDGVYLFRFLGWGPRDNFSKEVLESRWDGVESTGYVGNLFPKAL